MKDFDDLVSRVLTTACSRYGIIGFSANDEPLPVDLMAEPDGALAPIALYARNTWRNMGFVVNDLYDLSGDDDDDGRDDGFPLVLEEDDDALFGWRVVSRAMPDLPISMFLMALDFTVERIALEARLAQSLDDDKLVVVNLRDLIEPLAPQEKEHESLRL